MARFTVDFLGCKVSQTDAQEIRERLIADGHLEAGAEEAEVAVVNTCCVTNEAVRKSRQAARRAARTAKRVYVTGCGANLDGDGLASLPPNVTVVRLPSERTPTFVAGDVGAIGCVDANVGLDRTRAFVKVQDGCSFSCAFCVIPQVRGASRSRASEAVLGEIRRRVEQGHREVVLTGINLGCYRDRAAGTDLPALVRAAGAIAGLERLRLSSIEVNHVSPALLQAMRETPAVSAHLHVPLQSGDDDILAAMRRRYSAQTYLRRVASAEGFNLTTDVIVGFPGEDDAAFERTLRVVEEAGITKVHVFPYSPRPGTRTAAEDPVPPALKKERGARLRALSERASRRRWESKVGAEDAVLVDRPGRGYGDDYTPWLVQAQVGALVRARAVGVSEEGVVGVPV
jgi:threonylcarbamoyladenosine tRNA methylthiotransferase MtaB